MTVLDDVARLIIHHEPNALCDDCIAEVLHLSVRQHANHKTRELASRPKFHRDIGRCFRCGKRKKVIRYG